MANPRRGGFFYHTWKGFAFLSGVALRFLGLVFIFVVLASLVGFVVLRRTLSEDRLRSIVADQLQEVFHRPVQVDGVILTAQGFKLRGVRVIEKLDVPGQFLLTSDSAVVTVKLEALLRRRLELSHVKLSAPYIQLVRDAQGVWNFTDIFVSTRAASAVPVGRLKLPISLDAELTEIDGGTVKVDDRLKNESWLFEKVNVSARRFAVDRPFAVKASCDSVGKLAGRTFHGALSVEGSASLAAFDWKEAYVTAQKLRLALDGDVVTGSGSLSGKDRATLDLALVLPALGDEQWSRWFGKAPGFALPASRWSLKASFPEPGVTLVERVRVQAAPLAASASGRLDRTAAKPLLRAELAVDGFPLDGAASFYPAWAPYALRGSADLRLAVSGWLDRLQVHSAQLHLGHLGGTFPNLIVESGDLELSAAEDFGRVSATLKGGSLKAFANAFTEVGVKLSLAKNELKVEQLDGRWIDSRIKLKARVLDFAHPKQVALAGSIDRVRWEEAQNLVLAIVERFRTHPETEGDGKESDDPRSWVRTFKYVIPRRFPDSAGLVRVGSVAHRNFAFNDVELLWELHGVSPSLKRVSGDVKVGFGPGRVSDIPAVQASNKFLTIVFLPFVYMHKMNSLSVFAASTAYPKTLDFNRIEGEYGLTQGNAKTRCFFVDSPQMMALADGSADFGKETVDMNILTRLTSYRDPLPEWWVDELGRPAIGFRVLGPLDKPDLEPRLSKMAANEIEKGIAECRAKAKTRYAALEKLRSL